MKVIVATDGSKCSREAVDFLLTRPGSKDDHYIVLSVVEPVPREFGIGAIPDTTLSYEQALYDDAARVIASTAEEIRDALGCTVEAKVVTGFIAKSICEFAKSVDADLIVMGSHGRTGFNHFLLGSVAEEVLKTSPCSVQIIKDKKKAGSPRPKLTEEEHAGSV